jgi:hypothetical protein
MLAIDNHFRRVLVFCLDQAVEQKLDRLQRLAVASDEGVAFLHVNLEGRVAAIAQRFVDLHHETEVTEHGVE